MVTQNDVRAVQLAKAALRAGIDLLCEHADAAEISSVVLTGAFGSHIDPLRAMVLGMIPDCDPTRVHAATNAAGAGAVRALLSRRERAEMCQTARRVVKVETATQPRFQELFVAAMALPHAEAPTPWLAQAVQLPSPPSDSEQSRLGGVGSRRRRRRRGVSSRQRLPVRRAVRDISADEPHWPANRTGHHPHQSLTLRQPLRQPVQTGGRFLT